MERLTIGTKGPQVKALQTLLNFWMLPPVNYRTRPALPRLLEDGMFGPVTRDRLRDFQRTRGLIDNGEADFPTQLQLQPWASLHGEFLIRPLRLGGSTAAPASGKKPDDDGWRVAITNSGSTEETIWTSGDTKSKVEGNYKIGAEGTFPSLYILNPWRIAISAEYASPSGGLEAKMKFGLQDWRTKGPASLSPYFALSAETERLRNLSGKGLAGVEIGLQLTKPKTKPEVTVKVDVSAGARLFIIGDKDNQKPRWSVPLEQSFGFEVKF